MGITIDNQDVSEITIDGQEVQEVTIDGVVVWALEADNWLYNEGDGKDDWDIYNTGSVTTTKTPKLEASSDGFSNTEIYTIEKVDLTDVSSIEFSLYFDGVSWSPRVAAQTELFKDTDPYAPNTAAEKGLSFGDAGEDITVELDVEDLSGEYYIGFMGSINNGVLRIYSVKLID